MSNLGKKYGNRHAQHTVTPPADTKPNDQSLVRTPRNLPEPYTPPQPNQVPSPGLRGLSVSASDSQPFGTEQNDFDDMCGDFRSNRSTRDCSGRNTDRSTQKADIACEPLPHRSVNDVIHELANRLPSFWWLHLGMIVLTVLLLFVVIANLDTIMASIAYLVSRILILALSLGCIGIVIYLLIRRIRRR